MIDRVLEHTTGSGFERLAVERVFEPLGMTGRFEPADGAPGHAVSAAGEVPRPVRFAAGAAASAAGSRWWATAEDLLRFARRQLDGGPAAIEQRRRHADVPGRGFADGWALGWALWDRGPYRRSGGRATRADISRSCGSSPSRTRPSRCSRTAPARSSAGPAAARCSTTSRRRAGRRWVWAHRCSRPVGPGARSRPWRVPTVRSRSAPWRTTRCPSTRPRWASASP